MQDKVLQFKDLSLTQRNIVHHHRQLEELEHVHHHSLSLFLAQGTTFCLKFLHFLGLHRHRLRLLPRPAGRAYGPDRGASARVTGIP